MAQAQYDKFIELRKSGVDAKTARTQAYGETPVAPVAPLNPPAQSAPLPEGTTNQDVQRAVNRMGGDASQRRYNRNAILDGNIQNQLPQTVAGVNGEQFAVAPVNPQTGLTQPAPVAPAPVAPVTPTAPTAPPEAPKDETATIKAQNEAQMTLNKQKSDLAIQERKQAEADAKLASTPTDQKGVLNALVSGATVPTQNTAAYRNAQTQYKNYQKFSTMTPSQLVSNMKMGEIDTATSQLLANNPSYIQAKQEFEKFQKNQSINKMVQSVANGATGKVQEVDHGQEASDALAKKLGINETNADAYARIVSKNPDVVERVKNVSSLTRQLNTLVQERNAVYADLKKQYPDMSPSGIMTLMSSRTKQATDEIDALNSSLAMEQADLKTAMELAKGEYEATSADITLQSDIAKEQRQMDNALTLNQAEYDQKIAQQAQAMGTPELAIPSVIEQYASQGIFAQKSAQQHIADAKALIAKGGTLGEYISQMQKDFQAKPEYKAKFGAKATENYELKELGGKTYKFNQATGDYEVVSPITAGTGGDMRSLAGQFPGQAWAKNNNPAGITWNANFDKGIGTAKLLTEAGIQFSKGTARPASEGGNYVTFPTIEDGLKAQQIIMSQTYGNSTVGQMLASWVGTGEGENYAKQVAGMAGVDPNVKVSSLTPEQLSTLQMAKIKKESPGLYGLLSQGTGTQGTTGQYTDQNINDLAYLTELQEKNPTQAAKDMKELGYNARDLANYKAGNVPLTDKQKTASTDIMSAISDLVTGDRYDWNDAVGKFDLSRVIGTQDAVDAEVAINNLIAKMTLPNLGVLKGPMSDKDIQFIKEASSKLATKQSNASFERNLVDAYNLAARRAGMAEIKNLSDITTDTQKETVGGELDYTQFVPKK